MMLLISSGRGAKLAQNRTDGLALFDDDLALAPVAAAIDLIGRLRRQRDVLGNDTRREAEIVVAVVLGCVVQFQARRPGGVGKETFSHSDRGGDVANLVQHVIDRQLRRRLDLRQQGIEVAYRRRHRLRWGLGRFGGGHQVAGYERDLGVRFGRRRLVVAGDGIGQQLLRIERWNIGGQFARRQRQIAGDAFVGADSDRFAVAHPRGNRNAQRFARDRRLGERRQPVGLARAAQAIADAGDCAAQGALDLFRRAGEIGLAVERRKNGATHERGAAQSGEDRSGKPLHGEPAPVDQAAVAVRRKRRLIAEIDRLGMKSPRRNVSGAARPSLVQVYVPTSLARLPRPRPCARDRLRISRRCPGAPRTVNRTRFGRGAELK